MNEKRFAVLVDKPVPNIAYGPVILLGKNEEATAIAFFDSVAEAREFVGTFRKHDIEGHWNSGRLRILDRQTIAVVYELEA